MIVLDYVRTKVLDIGYGLVDTADYTLLRRGLLRRWLGDRAIATFEPMVRHPATNADDLIKIEQWCDTACFLR